MVFFHRKNVSKRVVGTTLNLLNCNTKTITSKRKKTQQRKPQKIKLNNLNKLIEINNSHNGSTMGRRFGR